MSLLLQVPIFAIWAWVCIPRERNVSVAEQRLTWDECVDRNVQRGTFGQALRMNKDSFDRLLLLVKGHLFVDEKMANLRGRPVVPELCLFCLMQHLAGASCSDIVDICATSVPSFCRATWRTSRAALMVKELDVVFPAQRQHVCDLAFFLCLTGPPVLSHGTCNQCSCTAESPSMGGDTASQRTMHGAWQLAN